MSITVRRARISDAATIAEFNRRLAWETEQKVLDADKLRPGVEAVFGDPSKGFYIVGELNGEVVAQLMITFEWSDWRNGWFWWIQSVFVREDVRRGGVFRTLYAEVERQANEAGNVIGLRLYVEKDNAKARTTYMNLGMHDAGYTVFEVTW